jgi:hypothetical protein
VLRPLAVPHGEGDAMTAYRDPAAVLLVVAIVVLVAWLAGSPL